MDESPRYFGPSFAELRRKRLRNQRRFYWFMQGIALFVLVLAGGMVLQLARCFGV